MIVSMKWSRPSISGPLALPCGHNVSEAEDGAANEPTFKSRRCLKSENRHWKHGEAVILAALHGDGTSPVVYPSIATTGESGQANRADMSCVIEVA